MRILLVENERKVANFIARALRENSYAVDVAETGKKALEVNTDVTYDAILLDLVRRGFHSGNARLCYVDLLIDRHRRRATRDQDVIPLTAKEFALLVLFLLHAPELVTRGEIVKHVGDCHFDSGTNLVEVYVNRLRQKIDQHRPAKLIHSVRGVGYRLGAPEG